MPVALNVQGAGGAPNGATIAHSIVDLNSSFAVQVNGGNNAIGIMANFLTGSPVAINALNGDGIIFRRKQSYRGTWRPDVNDTAKVDRALTCKLVGEIVACTELRSPL
jgi:hypothetical protein